MDGSSILLAVGRSKPESLKRNLCFWTSLSMAAGAATEAFALASDAKPSNPDGTAGTRSNALVKLAFNTGARAPAKR